MSEYVKVDAADTALLVRDGRLVSWVSDGAMLAHIKASNTIATARVLSAGECAALGFVGPLPHYSADSGAGVKRCTRELWAFAE